MLSVILLRQAGIAGHAAPLEYVLLAAHAHPCALARAPLEVVRTPGGPECGGAAADPVGRAGGGKCRIAHVELVLVGEHEVGGGVGGV